MERPFRFFTEPASVRVTIVGEFTDGVLRIAASRCSSKDHFVRRKGAAIAEGRLRKGRLVREVPMDSCDGFRFVEVARSVGADVRQRPEILNRVDPRPAAAQ